MTHASINVSRYEAVQKSHAFTDRHERKNRMKKKKEKNSPRVNANRCDRCDSRAAL